MLTFFPFFPQLCFVIEEETRYSTIYTVTAPCASTMRGATLPASLLFLFLLLLFLFLLLLFLFLLLLLLLLLLPPLPSFFASC